jgi:hypothetical protein
MTNSQFLTMLLTGIGLFLALLASQIGGFYFLSSRIDRISDDLKQFYRTLGQHDARLDAMAKHPN